MPPCSTKKTFKSFGFFITDSLLVISEGSSTLFTDIRYATIFRCISMLSSLEAVSMLHLFAVDRSDDVEQSIDYNILKISIYCLISCQYILAYTCLANDALNLVVFFILANKPS